MIGLIGVCYLRFGGQLDERGVAKRALVVVQDFNNAFAVMAEVLEDEDVVGGSGHVVHVIGGQSYSSDVIGDQRINRFGFHSEMLRNIC